MIALLLVLLWLIVGLSAATHYGASARRAIWLGPIAWWVLSAPDDREETEHG